MVSPFERRLFILPATILILALSIFPLIFSLGLTFTSMRLLGQDTRFVFLTNWIQVLQDNNFRQVLLNTLTFVVAGTILQYALGLGLALVLNEQIAFRRFLRISFILPMMISPVAISYVIGKMVLDENLGPIYDIAQRFHIPLASWTNSSPLSMLVLVLVDTWQWTPFFVLVLLAGLQAIQPELYEAARIDGASAWIIFRDITFPLLMPLTVTAILVRSLEMFKVVDIVRVVTGGGPGQATESVTLFAYDIGIKGGDIAYAATIAYVLLIVVILYANGLLAIARRITPSQG
jgi:multiple sugar transport system permease protein